MKNCLHVLYRRSALALSLLSLCGLGTLTLRAHAQTTDTSGKQDTQDTSTDKTKTSTTEKPKKEPVTLPAGNPLVLINPLDGSGNGTAEFDKYGNRKRVKKPSQDTDYTSNLLDDPRLSKPIKDLPLFGYNIFQYTRRLIVARNTSLLRMYEPNYETRPKRGTSRSTSRSGSGTMDTTVSHKTRSNDSSTAPKRNPQSKDSDPTLGQTISTPYDSTEGTDKTDAMEPKTRRRSQVDDNSPYSGRKLRDANADDTEDNGDETDNADNTGNNPRRRSQRNTTRSGDNTQDDGSDNGDDTSVRRSRQRSGMTGSDNADTMDDTTDDASNFDNGQIDNGGLTQSEQLAQARHRRSMLGLDVFQREAQGLSDTDQTDNLDNTTTTRRTGSNLTGRTQSTSRYSNQDYSQRSMRPSLDTEPVDALHMVADPLSQLYRNVIASAPTTYQLSGGDIVKISYWSRTLPTVTVTRTVDPQGNLAIPEVGVIVVRGMTLAQAETALLQKLKGYFKGVEVSMSIRELRTMSITVTGEAFETGTFTVPAVATAFNVLYWAGGPTQDGSLRNIEVRRHGKVAGNLDVYKLMVTGDQDDIPLQNGDQIYVSPSQSRVALRGEVRKNAMFELKEGETLKDALHFAGGVKATGVDQMIQVNTLAPGAARVLKDVDLKDKARVSKLALYDGDAVDIFSVRPVLANKVTVQGAVDQPSDYAMEAGMRVSDLIKSARGTLPEAYLARAELYRWNNNNTTTLIPVDLEKALSGDPQANFTLTRWDTLKVYARQEVAWTGYRKVTISGAIAKPGVYDLSLNTHISDLMRMAGGPRPDAYLERAVLLHQHGDGTFSYEFVNLADAVHGDPKADTTVLDNDYLAVYRNNQAQFTPDHLVTVLGEVIAPGVYPRGEGMHLSDLINLAGGFSPSSGLNVVVAHAHKPMDGTDGALKTVSVSFDAQRRCAPKEDVALEDGDVVTIQGQGGFQTKPQVVNVRGAVNKPGPIILTSKNIRLSDALKLAGGLRREAFPEGAEFYRDSKQLATPGQHDLAETISRLSDIFNTSEYNRQRAKSDIERIKASTNAVNDTSLLGGLTGSSSTAAAAISPAAGALTAQLSSRDLVSRPRILKSDDLQPNGNIAVNLPEALKRPGGNDDLLLVDGDTITVPEAPTTVQVIGAVVNPRGVLFKPGAPLDYYVSLAGGFAPDAAKTRMVVIHAGGGLIPANQVREMRPGDVILIPTAVIAAKLQSNQNNLDSVFKSLTSSLIVYKVATSIFGL